MELEASLRFGCREMPLGEILDLGPGDVVQLDRHVSDPVDLIVGDKIVARGEVVLVNGNFGLQRHRSGRAAKSGWRAYDASFNGESESGMMTGLARPCSRFARKQRLPRRERSGPLDRQRRAPLALAGAVCHLRQSRLHLGMAEALAQPLGTGL